MKKNLLKTLVLVVLTGTSMKAQWTGSANSPQTITTYSGGVVSPANLWGAMTVGPQNSNYCHITTTLDRFWFNKPLFLAGTPSLAAYNTSPFTISTDATYYGNTPRLIIMNGTGRTGIGTQTPGAMLDVTSTNPNDAGITSTVNATGDYTYGIVSKINRDLTKAFSVQNYATGVEKIVMYGNGNTCIDGILKVKELYVQLNVWADYVFNKTYKPMPLKDLEQYILTNKHLPEVPSTADVVKNGVNIAENQTMLLKKIEELTLYVIDQNKKIEALEKQVNKN
jgi:hypothetical protein